ncbi:MAG: polyprenyl synthetase family protein [Bacteroidia bacterium]|nr:polyprenyl synthetase family protein [Bacteroidia bacterium]
MSIHQLFSQYENYRKSQLFFGNPETLYAPMNYIMDLGGKRARPLLVLSSCISAGGEINSALPLAQAIEVFHNFTLLHDDIMDNAPLRRGKPTVHEKWDMPTAILAGDNMLVAAYEFLMNYSGPEKERIFSIFNKTGREVCEGQQMDMDFSQKDHVTEAEYLKMIELKTAVLLGCAAFMGATAGGSDEETAKLYYDLAIHVGLSFQLNDDWLDAFGNPEKTGKQPGGDIAEGKKTWLYIAAKNKELPIDEWFKNQNVEERISITLEALKAHALDAELKQLAASYEEKANQDIKLLKARNQNTAILEELIDMLAGREH